MAGPSKAEHFGRTSPDMTDLVRTRSNLSGLVRSWPKGIFMFVTGLRLRPFLTEFEQSELFRMPAKFLFTFLTFVFSILRRKRQRGAFLRSLLFPSSPLSQLAFAVTLEKVPKIIFIDSPSLQLSRALLRSTLSTCLRHNVRECF